MADAVHEGAQQLVFGGRESDGAIAELGAAQFAASSPPESLLIVPEIWTSILGRLYDPSAVKRVIHPVDVSHQGLVGFCAPTTVHSGTFARSAQ